MQIQTRSLRAYVAAPKHRRRALVRALVATSLVAGGVLPTASTVYAENWQLAFGPVSGYPDSGTGTFNATTASPIPGLTTDPGTDANADNNVVRSGDVQQYVWSLAANNTDGDVNTVNNLTLTQVLTPTAPLTVNDLEIVPLDSTCGAGSSINMNSPVGSITIVCNTGSYTQGSQRAVTVGVRPRGTAPNGSSFTSTQTVTATQTGGVAVSPAAYDLAAHPQGERIYITNRPAWNLSKHGFYTMPGISQHDPDGSGPAEQIFGRKMVAVYQLSSLEPYGGESLQQPITVHDIVSITTPSPSFSVLDAPYYIQSCSPSMYGSLIPGTVNGYTFTRGSWTDWPTYNVPTSTPAQTCTITRDDNSDPTSGFSLTFDNIDFDPASIPTRYEFNNGSLAAGPYYVMSMAVEFFIPLTTIDLGDGVVGNMTANNSIGIFNAVGDFDPDSVHGASNYGSGVEPGYCTATESGLPVSPNGGTGECDPMPGGSRSDNVIQGSLSYQEAAIGTAGEKRTLSSSISLLPSQTFFTTEDGVVEPGTGFISWVYIGNSSRFPQSATLCDVFDNSTAVLSTTSAGRGPYVTTATVLNGAPSDPNSIIEYGHVDLSTVDPLSQGYQSADDRYYGNWSAINAAADAGCDDNDPVADSNGVRWFTDPNQVPSGAGSNVRGVDHVNIVRARPVLVGDPAVPARNAIANSTNALTLILPLQARQTFFGGPNNGQPLPNGTIIANRANRMVMDDTVNGLPGVAWSPADYLVTSTGTWGERVTVRPGRLNVLKRSLQNIDTGYDDPETGVAITSKAGSTYNVTGTGAAGDYVVFELLPDIVATLDQTTTFQNVRLVDTLPSGLTYDAACTAFTNGGQLPDTVEYNTPGAGQTRLTWNYDASTPATVFAAIRVCARTDAFALNNTSYVNSVSFSASTLPTATDTHTVTMSQGTQLRTLKTVDAPLDPLDDDQVWTLAARNFSPTIAYENVKVLEVFPFNGDDTTLNGGLRTPATDLDGAYTLVSMPTATRNDGTTALAGTYWFTADGPASIDQNPDSNIAAASTNWCTTEDGGTTWAHVAGPGNAASCPTSLADATGFMFLSDSPLAVIGDSNNSGLRIRFTMSADGNDPDNIYTNRFTLDSSTFPTAQYLISNPVTVRVFGFRLGDFVWVDTDEDGRRDAGEAPAPDGVEVILYRDLTGDGPSADDTLVTTTSTLAGVYEFRSLIAGTYYVRIPASEFQAGGTLEAYDITPAGAEPSGSTLNDPDGHDGRLGGSSVATGGIVSNTVTLSASIGATPVGNAPTGENIHSLAGDPLQDSFHDYTLDLAVVELQVASLGDFVWVDADADGVQDAGELGLAGVTVTLFGADGTTVVATTTTDDTGFYEFVDLLPGTYTVTFTQPTGYELTSIGQGDPSTDSNGLSSTVTLAGGEHDPTIDLGVYEFASLGDFVWVDADADGVQDAGELGLAGVTVTLYGADGTTVVATTTTDGDGFYEFVDLLPGTYTVTFTQPTGYELTSIGQGDPSTDSNGLSTTVTLAGGEHDPTIDLGVFEFASLGDYVWVDTNADGVQDAGEVGLAGVTVTLYGADGTTVVGTTTTDGDGFYEFTELVPGTYTVTFTPPAGYELSPTGEGTLSTDSNGVTSTVTLAGGEHDPTIDLGVYELASVGDFVWVDADADGVQDAGELGLAGVTVTLYGADGTTAVATTTTDGDGFYEFTELVPGTYTVTFTQPTGYELTPIGQGDPSTDSNGLTTTVTLESGDHDPTIDLGLYQVAIIGDRVWEDLNADGVQDGGEPGVPGVMVTLYGADGTTVVGTTTTDDTGFYEFTELDPGTYTVTFTQPAGYELSPTGAGTLSTDSNGVTSTVTIPSGGADVTIDLGIFEFASLGDYVWVDTNADGVQDAGEVGLAGVTVTLYGADGTTVVGTTTTDGDGFYEFTDLVPGTYTVTFTQPGGYSLSPTGEGTVSTDSNGLTTTVTLESGDHDPTIDLGVWMRPAIDIVKQVCVLSDQNTCDPENESHWGEYTVLTNGAVATFRITVTNTGSVALAPVSVTDPLAGDCDAQIDALPVGASYSYTCTLDPVPGWLLNTATATGNPADDDGNDVPGVPDVTDSDTAEVQLSPDLVVTKSSSKPAVAQGGTVDYTLTVANQGLGPATGVVAVDTLPVGMDPLALPAALSYDPATRQLTWAIGELGSGAMVSITYSVQIAPTATGSLVNTVVVGSQTPGDPTRDNEAETPVTVTRPIIPTTGSDSAVTLWLAFLLVLCGSLVALLSRRRGVHRP